MVADCGRIGIFELLDDYIRINTIFFPGYHARAIDVERTLRKICLVKIEIRTHGFALTDGMRDCIERRVARPGAAADLVIETDSKECTWNG